jgi:YggT family protein
MFYFGNAAIFLIQVVFGLFILLTMVRFLLQLARADFYNPLSQAIVRITNPLLLPLRKIIPGLWGADLASVVLLFALKALELFLIGSRPGFGGLIDGVHLHPAGLAVFTIADLLQLAIYVAMFALLIQVILSWVSPQGAYGNPVASLVYYLTEPLLRPARRILPPLGGLDLSPLVVFVLLQLTVMIVIAPIKDFGLRLL